MRKKMFIFLNLFNDVTASVTYAALLIRYTVVAASGKIVNDDSFVPVAVCAVSNLDVVFAILKLRKRNFNLQNLSFDEKRKQNKKIC